MRVLSLLTKFLIQPLEISKIELFFYKNIFSPVVSFILSLIFNTFCGDFFFKKFNYENVFLMMCILFSFLLLNINARK